MRLLSLAQQTIMLMMMRMIETAGHLACPCAILGCTGVVLSNLAASNRLNRQPGSVKSCGASLSQYRYHAAPARSQTAFSNTKDYLTKRGPNVSPKL